VRSIEIGCAYLDWVQLSEGMEVPATRVTSLLRFAKALRLGLRARRRLSLPQRPF